MKRSTGCLFLACVVVRFARAILRENAIRTFTLGL